MQLSAIAVSPKQWSLKIQLGLAFTLFSVLVVGVVGLAIWSIVALQATVNTTFLSHAEQAHYASDIAAATLQCRRFEKDFFLDLQDEGRRNEAYARWEAAHIELDQAISVYASVTGARDVQEQVVTWKAESNKYGEVMRNISKAIEAGYITTAEEANLAMEPFKGNIRSLTDWALATAEVEQQSLQESNRSLSGTIATMVALVIGCGAAAILCAVACSLFFPRRMLTPLNLLHKATQRIAQGDLTTRVEVQRSDEIGQVLHSFNTMAATIQQQRAGLVDLKVAEAARDAAEAAQAELAEKLATIEQQQHVIREMSVPILPVTRHTLVLPLVGALDTERIRLVQDAALRAVQQAHARTLIVDITGVPIVDTQVAQGLLQVVQASRLLGAEVVLVGIRPEVAQSIVGLGLQLSNVVTRNTLQGGIEYALRERSGARALIG
jgi:rsbT co-antagonist protein RsbR